MYGFPGQVDYYSRSTWCARTMSSMLTARFAVYVSSILSITLPLRCQVNVDPLSNDIKLPTYLM
ncbi:hypothetical protein SAMN05661091_2991 [Paenibacillus uliginis N3/975]|uniref:Uncharacterized protein n=1 Tax=Paenibacillus uliginis N3/975 TaxID=1313296 RepID=A0A1X7HGE7_9BACL|nr:hypothetical protein SAMN05661091_2991 [Paenibacillus uliginis N3/975]